MEREPLPTQLPGTNVTQDNLEAWITECGNVKEEIKNYGAKEKEAYQTWHESVVRKLAPGYIGGSNTLLTPQKKSTLATNDNQLNESTHQTEVPEPPKEPLNDIDRAFSTLDIK
ncbi:Multivesicular body sorting factor 12 [Wickerhamomyces ciferrii]|uniref:Multivesicular body sorting factor 12 n=1 Tax=Wickerhamomyces ciferrii (strain ATCC 14091 / BCRC 22168 / CBS 111 / JCM 3599 / NBRC 0793 / NRRL Y-1031 F-60-10) TaxID=1206466 RepID=K0KSE9_WICCF|nr:Multivesicular body sorting factor 12 [Wickerhamomyces ciferrii]CCH44254.1 Multivesicular body sorting factor 12 [Wickerhamomyces ciferrii]